jgi:hypothetical protein
VARCLCTIRVNSLCSCLCFYRMLTQWCLYCILPRSVVIWCRITVYVIVLTWISVSSDLSSHLLSIDTACPSTGALNWLSIGLSMSVSCAHISSLIGLCVYVPMYPHIVPWFSYISTIYLSTDLSLFMFPEPSWSIFRPLPWTTLSAKKPFLQQQSAWLLRKPPLPCHRGGGPQLGGGWGGGGGPGSLLQNRSVIWKMLIRDLSRLVVYFSRPVQRWLVKLCRGLEIDEDARWTLRQRRPRTVPCCDQGRGTHWICT